jgi:hypothetical protein
MSLSRRYVARLVLTCVFLFPASLAPTSVSLTSPAQAGMLTLAGNATGTNARALGWASVTLGPNPALLEYQCSWLYAAATNNGTNVGLADPYNVNPNNPWVFQYNPNFQATFTMGGFTPAGGFPRSVPNGNYQSLIGGTVNNPTRAGAVFDIGLSGYTAPVVSAAAMTAYGTSLEWMQVIYVNQVQFNYDITHFPTTAKYYVAGNGTNGVPAGFYAYMDDGSNVNSGSPINPFYGYLSLTGATISTSAFANTNGILDRPIAGYVPGGVLDFQTFLVSTTITPYMQGNVQVGVQNTVTIEGGVWWGINQLSPPPPPAPEPGSWLLLAIGFGTVAYAGRSKLLRRSPNPV